MTLNAKTRNLDFILQAMWGSLTVVKPGNQMDKVVFWKNVSEITQRKMYQMTTALVLA